MEYDGRLPARRDAPSRGAGPAVGPAPRGPRQSGSAPTDDPSLPACRTSEWQSHRTPGAVLGQRHRVIRVGVLGEAGYSDGLVRWPASVPAKSVSLEGN